MYRSLLEKELRSSLDEATSILDRLRREHRARLYLDVTPLLEESWTGIPVVTSHLARQLLSRGGASTAFFIGSHLINQAHVKDALDRRTGLFLQRDHAHGKLLDSSLYDLPADEISVGIFPSVKHPNRAFDIECSIVHDLTTITVPQFHTPENIRYHSAIAEDLSSNDITFCISTATQTDIEVYFGSNRFELVQAYNGVSWPDDFPVRALSEFDPLNVEPYFLILGTREPRKNIATIMDLLAVFPDVCEKYRFVIAGKVGWMSECEELPAATLEAIEKGQITFTGFVSEFEKYKLLLGAEATIYPSFLEGFGLPIIESLSVGTPCIASMSSSMPEVGGDVCFYFDPFSVTDLYKVVRQVQTLAPKKNTPFVKRCKLRAAEFSWENTCLTILRALEKKLNSANERQHLTLETREKLA